jgi:uncharacterized membrane protein
MNASNRVIHTAFASLIALGLSTSASQVLAAKGDTEKCAGIVKAGKNDCGTSKSACAGSIKVDNDPEAWVALPKGTCEKLLGGRIITANWAKPGGAK